MRINDDELYYEDIMWFAIDKNGFIAEFTSGVYGNIPEMICESRENLDLICNFFYGWNWSYNRCRSTKRK